MMVFSMCWVMGREYPVHTIDYNCRESGVFIDILNNILLKLPRLTQNVCTKVLRN